MIPEDNQMASGGIRMEKYFKLAQDEPIVIYGAAAIGLIFYDICKELHIPVLGFMDKRGDEICELQGLSVWDVEGSEVINLDKNTIIFVAVKNVFEHDNIVRKLLSKGFSNIIYRPYAVIKGAGSRDEELLYETYTMLMNKELVKANIPKTFAVHSYEYKDYSTIKKLEGERVIYVPAEILFTDKKKNKQVRWNWLDLPIMSLIPHIDFFRWMNRQEEYCPEKYLQFCINAAKVKGQIKITERWKENVIKNRADVYANMNEALERDPDFFIRNAPIARWNAKGYFNLVSGKHRAAFLVSKGRQYIPLRITEADYDKWIDLSQMGLIVEKLKKENVYEVHAPIEHPFFYNITCENKTFYYKLLCDFIYAIATYQYEDKGYVKLDETSSVFISLNDDGYFSRSLQRYGIKVETHNESFIGKLLNGLVKTNKKSVNNNCRFAFVEFNYGMEINFDSIMSRKMEHIICLVADKDINKFEKSLDRNYLIKRKESCFKDGEKISIYWMEKNNVVW